MLRPQTQRIQGMLILMSGKKLLEDLLGQEEQEELNINKDSSPLIFFLSKNCNFYLNFMFGFGVDLEQKISSDLPSLWLLSP
jgi:hypothetical protein